MNILFRSALESRLIINKTTQEKHISIQAIQKKRMVLYSSSHYHNQQKLNWLLVEL